jgi:cysteinyl-tRNA synthetase
VFFPPRVSPISTFTLKHQAVLTLSICGSFLISRESCSLSFAVRRAARAGDSASVLRICDELRDVALPPLGVLLEDESSAGAASAETVASSNVAWTGKWKLYDPAQLQKELEDKRNQLEEKARSKAAAAAEAAIKLAEKEAKARVDPRTMFVSQTDKFSAFDADGLPTHDAAGVEIAKPARKRLAKDQTQQAKLHQWWLSREIGGASTTTSGPVDDEATE